MSAAIVGVAIVSIATGPLLSLRAQAGAARLTVVIYTYCGHTYRRGGFYTRSRHASDLRRAQRAEASFTPNPNPTPTPTPTPSPTPTHTLTPTPTPTPTPNPNPNQASFTPRNLEFVKTLWATPLGDLEQVS